jgi:hypothetical protein
MQSFGTVSCQLLLSSLLKLGVGVGCQQWVFNRPKLRALIAMTASMPQMRVYCRAMLSPVFLLSRAIDISSRFRFTFSRSVWDLPVACVYPLQCASTFYTTVSPLCFGCHVTSPYSAALCRTHHLRAHCRSEPHTACASRARPCVAQCRYPVLL